MFKKLVLTFLSFSFLFGINDSFGNTLRAEKGMLDLKTWNFPTDGTIKLSGEWEFYWNTFLSPADFRNPGNKPEPAYVQVPDSWSSRKNGSHPASGFGTYRLVLRIRPDTNVAGIRLYDIFSASKVWFDGKQIYSTGSLGKSKAASRPGFAYTDVPVFMTDTAMLHELVIQVSNFDHTRAGIIKPISMGLFSQLAHQTKSMLLLNLIIIGIILVIGMNHLITYFLRPKDRSNLYFGLLCLVMIIRNISIGDRIITFIVPSMNWELLFKLDNFSGFGTIPLFALFLALMFRNEFPRRVLQIIVGIGVLISLFVFVTPQVIYGKYRMFYELYVLAGGLYLTFGVLARASWHRREGAFLSFAGLFVLYATAINDVLVSMGVASSPDVAPFGLVFYMLTQSFILTRASTHAMAENEQLGKALHEEKLLLEKRVEERTRELQKQNLENIRQKKELEVQGWFNNNLARINSVLNAEKDNIEVLCRKLIGELLAILNAQVGAIYLADEQDNQEVLRLAGSLNASRETLLKRSIFVGEGMVGACYKEQQSTLVADVAETYVKVSSGLGESNPRNILLVPLTTHNTTIGVIEIASLNAITEAQVQLMERSSESIASSLQLLQIHTRNVELSNKYHQKAKELSSREEEAMQQLEEMRAMQEQLERYRRENVN